MAAVETTTVSGVAETLATVTLDEQIEDLLRHNKSVTVTRSHAPVGPDPEGLKWLPEESRKRLEDDGIDLSKGYPVAPSSEDIPVYVDQAYNFRNEPLPFTDRAKFADPEKKALFGTAKEVRDITKKILRLLGSNLPTSLINRRTSLLCWLQREV